MRRPAYDTDPRVSSVWSPRDAIVERYNQIGRTESVRCWWMCGLIGLKGFTLVECILSGIYVWSLLGLLNLKSSVRQRRVMLDLIYVNIIIVCLDIVVCHTDILKSTRDQLSVTNLQLCAQAEARVRHPEPTHGCRSWWYASRISCREEVSSFLQSRCLWRRMSSLGREANHCCTEWASNESAGSPRIALRALSTT